MLKKYEQDQPYACKLLNNIINKNKPSHAYLFEVNGYNDYNNLILSFVKELMTNDIDNKKTCDLICEKIDANVFSELKVIFPDGSTIKKEQIEDLQNEFKNKSVEANKKIYIIHEAEKMNNSSSNALLKFLEEPSNDIIAILITNNSYQLLPTIKSRCQIIKLRKTSLSDTDKKEDSVNYTESMEQVVSFIEYYEKNLFNSLIYIKKLWHNFFNDKENVSLGIKFMISFYKDLLNYKIENQLNNNDYFEQIKELSNLNSIEQLLKKINILINLEQKIIYNINLSLLMDKLIIEFGKVDEKANSY